MRISRIYYDGELHKNTNICLPPQTSHYIMNVLRLKVGSNIHLFNGDGKEFLATIIVCEKKNVTVTIGEFFYPNNESPLKIHLVQGVSRGDKMDLTIQKAVELGVTGITPLITQYCTIQLKEDRLSKRMEHWQKNIVSACEQSGRAMLPFLTPLCSFKDWINIESPGLKFFCDPKATTSFAALPKPSEVLILIGPEGGLSPSEIRLMEQQAFLGISLGPRILRTETAGFVALSILQNLWGDLGGFSAQG